MKKQLLVAAVAALVAGNALAILPITSFRTPVINNSSKDVWMGWGGLQAKTKNAYYHLKPDGDQFTTTHYTSDKLILRYYVCENGNPVQKQVEFVSELRKGNIIIKDNGINISVSEEKQK